MAVLIDTNVVLDIMFERSNATIARQVFIAAKKTGDELFVTASLGRLLR